MQQNHRSSFALAFTNERVHGHVRSNLDRSPLYTGAITGRGPRYCPSLEDKVVRFADRDRHQLFLEPGGLDSGLLYINGFSTSLPPEVQLDMVRGAGARGRVDGAARLRGGVRLRRPHRAEADPRSLPDRNVLHGRIRITWLSLQNPIAVIGLSRGGGIPAGYVETDFIGSASCPVPVTLALPSPVTEGAGLLTNVGSLTIPSALTNALTVSLKDLW